MDKRTQAEIDQCNEIIDLIQHWQNGGDVEKRFGKEGDGFSVWQTMDSVSKIDLDTHIYRKKITKITVEWSLLPDFMKWVARNPSGEIFCFSHKPQRFPVGWCRDYVDSSSNLTGFPFVDPGTCAWEDSLLKRPEGGGD